MATAIATELELSDDQVNDIQLAAIIHDLGKIHIPAEILSKPGKLSDIEFLLIQTHPQAGYPQVLKDDQILLEAQILTAADVVEAIVPTGLH